MTFTIEVEIFGKNLVQHIGVSQNRRRFLDFDGRWGKLGLGKKIKDDPMALWFRFAKIDLKHKNRSQSK